MDPITAMGVASNVIQFIDFAAKLISDTWEVRKSANGTLASNDHVQRHTEELFKISQKLKRHPEICDLELEALCRDCDLDANLLLEALEKLKVQGPNTRFKSLGKALDSVLGREKRRELEGRLAGYRDAMNLRVLVNFREQYDLVALRAEGHFGRLDAHAKALLDAVIESRDVFETALKKQTEILRLFHEETNVAVEESRSQVAEAIEASDAVSRMRHETTQSEVEQLNATLALVRQEMQEQSAAIVRLQEERDNASGLREVAAVQAKIDAAYTAFFKLAVLLVSLQVGQQEFFPRIGLLAV